MARTDVHRPTEINPEDYQFVCVQFLWSTEDDALGEALYNKEQREIFWAHKEKTGGKFANIEHGGTCFCCGARARFVARYYHEKTNSYVDLGERCAIKLDDGDADAFKTLRRSIKNARESIAGKRKAQTTLSDLGLSKAWEIFETKIYSDVREEQIIIDVVHRLVKKGNISEKQVEFVRKLVNYLENKDAIEAERKAKLEAEKAAAAPCPSGRVQVTGVILTVKVKEGTWGTDLKVLVRDDSGFKVWGNLPSELKSLIKWDEGYNRFDEREPRLVTKEPRIEFTATITPSQVDTKFGFFKRPSKAKVLSGGIQEENNQSL